MTQTERLKKAMKEQRMACLARDWQLSPAARNTWHRPIRVGYRFGITVGESGREQAVAEYTHRSDGRLTLVVQLFNFGELVAVHTVDVDLENPKQLIDEMRAAAKAFVNALKAREGGAK